MTGGVPGLVLRGLFLLTAAAIAGALWVIALRPPAPDPGHFAPAAPVNSIQAVTLTTGQVFFGTLRATTGSALILVDVFEGQTVTNPQTKERSISLVARHDADWHAPVDMAIQLDKILFTESVGRDSIVARQIAQIKALPASGRPAPDAK